IKEGTGPEHGSPAQHLSTNRLMMIEPSSRLYLGKGNGYMPTQYVVGADTIYVNDYFEDKEGRPLMLHVLRTGDDSLITLAANHPDERTSYAKAWIREVREAHFSKNITYLNQYQALGLNVNVMTDTGNTPLLEAIVLGNPDIVLHLLKFGASPNYYSTPMRSPMMVAFFERNLKIMRLLHDFNGDIKHTPSYIDCWNTKINQYFYATPDHTYLSDILALLSK
ncbi:MAG: hypothetical protein V4490_00295, partial [Pseudomonadota bacterium]